MQIEPTHSYPAIFEMSKGDKCVYVRFPDFDNVPIANIGTFGADFAEAYFMAQDYMFCVLCVLEEEGESFPEPTPEEKIKTKKNEKVLQVMINYEVFKEEYPPEPIPWDGSHA